MNYTSARTALASVLLLAILPPVTLSADQRTSETVTCNAVKRSAKAGHYPSDVVGLTIVDSGPECRFAINGASVGSPPPGLILGGINSVISGRAVSDIGNKDLKPLAYALLAASPDNELSQDLLRILEGEIDLFARCLARLDTRQVPDYIQGKSAGCGRIDPSRNLADPEVDLGVPGGKPMGLTLLAPALVIGVARPGQTNYFVMSLLKDPKQELRPR